MVVFAISVSCFHLTFQFFVSSFYDNGSLLVQVFRWGLDNPNDLFLFFVLFWVML